jgi:hypothetical protein
MPELDELKKKGYKVKKEDEALLLSKEIVKKLGLLVEHIDMLPGKMPSSKAPLVNMPRIDMSGINKLSDKIDVVVDVIRARNKRKDQPITAEMEVVERDKNNFAKKIIIREI